MKYRIHYEAKDGTFRYFTMESDRRMVPGGRINVSTNPLLTEVMKEFYVRKNDPKSAMSKHGGCRMLREIENVETGTIHQYALYV